MKFFYFLLLTLAISSLSFGQGNEDFANSNATSAYATDSFIGNNSVIWSYVSSRDAASTVGVTVPAIMLRQVSDNSKISSSTISGGIGNFSVKLYKGFTGAGTRQVELLVNGVSKGTSVGFDNYDEQTFAVDNINIAGDITIEIVNTTGKQVIIDDISWTAFQETGPICTSAEGFETFPLIDWTLSSSNTSNSVTQSVSWANSGTNSLRFTSYDQSGSPYDQYAVTPQLVTTDGDQTISFYYKSSNGPEVFKVGISSAGDDVANDFTWSDEIVSSSTAAQYSISDLPVGTTYVAIHYYSNYQWYMYVDDFCMPALYVPDCVAPTALVAANLTSTTADISWTSDGTTFNVEYGASGFTQGTGTTSVVSTNAAALTALAANTSYDVYVQNDCGTSGMSTWTDLITFTTQCVSVAEFSENFDSVNAPQLPDCWSELIGGGAPSSAYVETSISGDTNVVKLYNSSSTTGDIILVSPPVSNLASNTHRLKLQARNSTATQDIQIGTLSDPSDSSTFTLLETVDINFTFAEYIIDFSSYTGTDIYIGFRRLTTSTYTYVYLDDIIWEEIPSTPPGCAFIFSDTSDTSCGNNDFSISWDGATNADGYYISVGTTTGGTDIEASTDLGNVTTYDFTSVTVATTYYYTVVPYNASGSASECAEQNLTTVETGCYCISTPSSNDGDGISNVFFGDSEFTSAGDTIRYEDFTATAVSISQSTSAKLDITFATGLTYTTHVWVDFNDDYNFSSDELMFSGESTSANPVTLDASFLVPSDAPLGDHRVRVVTTDFAQTPPNPCYDGTWGVTIDMTITVTDPPSCLAPSALTAAGITNNSVNLTWTAGAIGTTWEYQFVEAETPPAETEITTSDNPLVLTGLSDTTEYDFYVRANCGADGTSEWVTVSFTTLPDPIVPEYANDFSTFPGEFWMQAEGALADGTSGTTSSWVAAGFLNVGTTGSARLNIYSPWSPTEFNDWLLSPQFDLSTGDFFLNMDVAVTAYIGPGSSAMGSDDSVTVVITNDNGANWSTLYVWNADNAPANEATPMPEVDLASYNGLVRIGILGSNGAVADSEDFNFYVDNFSVTSTSLGIDTVSKSNFTYFPNPVNNVLSIKAQASIDSITVYNMLGQTVVRSTPNTTTTTVDMSGLQTGAYFVQVSINNSIETVRVIKN